MPDGMKIAVFIASTSQLLGNGAPLFGKNPEGSIWKRTKIEIPNDYLMQTTYVRDRERPLGRITYGKAPSYGIDDGKDDI
jgi:hypothetical protein